MSPSDDDDMDLPTIGKKCKSLGHNMVWLFPSSSHMGQFVQGGKNGRLTNVPIILEIVRRWFSFFLAPL